MQENKLLVRVARNILVLELCVESLVDAHVSPISLREDGVELWRRDTVNVPGVLGHASALLGEAFDADDLGFGEGACPFGDEDVVFEVRGDDVRDWGGANGLSHGRGQGDWREDGKGIVLEADWGWSAVVRDIRDRKKGILSVPRPPILKSPAREKGREKVVMLAVSLRIDITAAGSDGVVMATEV